MLTRRWIVAGAAGALAAWLVLPASAAIVSISGATSASVQELRGDTPGDADQASETFPGTSNTLPLQVVGRLISQAENAAATAAAQLEDPLTSTTTNPQDIAIDVVLDSVGPTIHYTGHARVDEVRSILYSPSEVNAGSGQTLRFQGQLFLDGALAVFATPDATDLTGATVTLNVTITKEVANQTPQQVFAGTLVVTAGANRQVTISATGDIPTRTIVNTDLSGITPDVGVFHAFVLPNLVLSYTYNATVNEPFSLRATVDVQAANPAGGIGVAAILGTPLTTLTDVLNLTRAAPTAKTINDAIQSERENPTGQPAFPQPPVLLPACGLFGLESALGFLGLVGLLGWTARAKVR